MENTDNVIDSTGAGQSDQIVRKTHRHSGRRHRHRNRQLPLIMSLAGILLASLVLVLFVVIKLNSLSNTNDLLASRLQESEDELIKIRTELQQTKRQLEAAVENRFPQLRRLEFDKVIPLHEGLVQNILFTLIKKSEKNHYEYKLVMENDSGYLSAPKIKVLLFGRLGAQLGANEIPKQEPLLRGETRSHSAVVDLAIPGEPYYFYVGVN